MTEVAFRNHLGEWLLHMHHHFLPYTAVNWNIWFTVRSLVEFYAMQPRNTQSSEGVVHSLKEMARSTHVLYPPSVN